MSAAVEPLHGVVRSAARTSLPQPDNMVSSLSLYNVPRNDDGSHKPWYNNEPEVIVISSDDDDDGDIIEAEEDDDVVFRGMISNNCYTAGNRSKKRLFSNNSSLSSIGAAALASNTDTNVTNPTSATFSQGSDNSHYQTHGAYLDASDTTDSASSADLRISPFNDAKRRRRGKGQNQTIVEPLITPPKSKNDVVYVPPRKPVIKAAEVKVRVIPDDSKPPTVVVATTATTTTNTATTGAKHPYDDDDGHYIVKEESDFTNRYQISKLLGQGTFGKVVAAYDKHRKQQCAIKIIRSVSKYRDASKIELRVLKTLSRYDRENLYKCIRLRECFDYRNHICIVTDLLGCSLYDFLKGNDFMPLPGAQIQDVARQIFRSVSFLHDLNLIHTDLKPENILLDSSDCEEHKYKKGNRFKVYKKLRNTSIHLIDFGSAVFSDEFHSSVVSTRHYRAPEIIFGIGWSFPCDIWSIGCIMVELCTGDALFQTHDNLEHVALMEKIIGRKFDKALLRRVRTSGSTAAGAGSSLLSPRRLEIGFPSQSTKKSSVDYVQARKPFHQLITDQIGTTEYSRNHKFWSLFLDLLDKILVYDPNDRITAREALAHPWFSTSLV